MAFGDTEERLSQFGDKWHILNAIREHYLMKREADHIATFLGSDFLGLGLQSFTPASQYICTAARRANLVVPEIGVLKWFLEIRKNGSVNLEINGRF